MPTDPNDAPALPAAVDVLVVGGGPAGLSAATWLGRYRRRTLVVDAGSPRNRAVTQIHGLLGRDPVAPARLRADALDGLTQYPHVTVHEGTVDTLVASGDRFVARIDGRELVASRVVLATGVRDRFPEVAGFADHYGVDVFHCPTCEGYEARDRAVVVLGWGEHVPAFATELLDWATSVTIVSDGPAHEISREQRARCGDIGIEVVDGRAEELLGVRGQLRAVRLADGRELPAGMVFFSLGHEPNAALAVGLGCALTEEGVVAVDEHGETSVPGVYAAGDLTPGMQLVPVAIAKGTVAGVACARSLQGDRTVPAAPAAAPEPEVLAPAGTGDEPGPPRGRGPG